MDYKLAVVDSTRSDWRIRVRITRMWPSFASNQHFLGFNMILLDSEVYFLNILVNSKFRLCIFFLKSLEPIFFQNFHVLAYVYPVVWNSIGNMILEGNAYDVINFVVREPIGYMRPVSSDKVIVFTNASIVIPVPLEVVTIPRHKFEIRPLHEIHDIARSYGSNVNPLHAIGIIILKICKSHMLITHIYLSEYCILF